jgi:predicted nucleic acid-binding protein
VPDVVTNTSPLLYLHRLGRLDLLPTLYETLVVPEAVLAELGVLLRAKTNGHVRAIEPLLADLERLGFRLAADTRAAVLNLAGE